MSHFRLKCTKFDFGWVSVPDTAGGTYSVPRDCLARFKGRRGGKGKTDERKEREVRGKRRRRKEKTRRVRSH